MDDQALARPWQSFLWLSRRECHRVLRLWTQTTLAPVVSSLLFIVVFGLSLGGRIKQVDGFDYDQFIVPGLVAMAMAQAAYSNNASTIFQGRNDRFIDDVLAAPIHHWRERGLGPEAQDAMALAAREPDEAVERAGLGVLAHRETS